MVSGYSLAPVHWNIDIDRVLETAHARLVFGQLGNQAVVARFPRGAGDERRSADVLSAFGGRSVVRLIDRRDDAVLIERLQPGQTLASVVARGDDQKATAIVTDVIAGMSPASPPPGAPRVADWGRAFAQAGVEAQRRLPSLPVAAAAETFWRLADSQSTTRLLHGDLHHDNILFDSTRGWLAIDPKGVVGELEYEVGAALRNPASQPEVFNDPGTIRRRIDRFARDLRLDRDRIAAWAFAQTVLALIWMIENDESIAADHPWVTLAEVTRQSVA